MGDSSAFGRNIKEASICAFVIDSWDYKLWDV